MKINKKAEGTASRFLIATLIGMVMLVMFGSLVYQGGQDYGSDSIDFSAEDSYFRVDEYNNTFKNVTGAGTEYQGEYENNQTPNYDRFEDLQFFKGFKIVDTLKGMSGAVTSAFEGIAAKLKIPGELILVIGIIIGVILITNLVKVIRGFRDV